MSYDQITYADACALLNRKIVKRYGNDPDAVDGLTIQVLPAPNAGSDRRGFAIIAYPAREEITSENVLGAYYGDALPEREER